VSAVSGRIEARELYVALGGTLLGPFVGGVSAPLLWNFKILISKMRIFVDF